MPLKAGKDHLGAQETPKIMLTRKSATDLKYRCENVSGFEITVQ